MSQAETEYRSTTNRIGGALSFFFLLFEVMIFITSNLFDILDYAGVNHVTANVIYQIVYAAAYMFSFMIPVAFFKTISKKHKTQPLRLEPQFPEHFILWLLAALAAILAASIVNTQIFNAFNITDLFDHSYTPDAKTDNYLIVLNYILVTLVPPFCEEFLFRGMVFENLRPYGKTTAIIGSAALFSLMHQNTSQAFYTFCGGIVLAIVYEKSKSVWPGIIIHIFNNQISNLYSEFDSIFGSKTAYNVSMVLESLILISGLISAFVLVTIESKKKTVTTEASGAMGLTLKQLEGSSEKITSKQLIKGFFTPWMIVFAALSVLSAFTTLLSSILQISFY